jgi:hypothetical protein
MTVTQLAPQTVSRGWPTKFTPERIMHQITNLSERGKAPEEIAEIIGITTDALQVICSKLGICLRRRRFDIGTGVRSRSYRKAFPHQAHSCQETTMPEPVEEPQPISLPVGEAEAAVPSEGARPKGSGDPASVVVAMRMNYKNKQRSIAMPFDQAVVGQLVLEAEIRGMRIGELVAAIVVAIMKKDLSPLLGDHFDGPCLHTPTKPIAVSSGQFELGG